MKNIYLKTEPAGEIGFGKLDDENIKVIKSLIKSKGLKNSEFIDGPHNFTQQSAYGVFINEWDDRHRFDTVEDAIDFANSYHNKEGIYPDQFEPGWHIGPIMKFPKKEQK